MSQPVSQPAKHLRRQKKRKKKKPDSVESGKQRTTAGVNRCWKVNTRGGKSYREQKMGAKGDPKQRLEGEQMVEKKKGRGRFTQYDIFTHKSPPMHLLIVPSARQAFL